MEMEMDFLGIHSPPVTAPPADGHGGMAATHWPHDRMACPQQAMLLAARRSDEPSKFSVPKLRSPAHPHAVDPGVPVANQKPSVAPCAQVHAMRVSLSHGESSFAAAAHLANGVGMPPIVSNLTFQGAMSGSYLPGSGIVQNAPSPASPGSMAAPISTAQLTIFYAGSVYAFDNVPREKAEQIMFLAAKVARAGSTPAVRRPLPHSESAALPNERQMTTAWDQTHVKVANSVRPSPDNGHAIAKKATSCSPEAVMVPRDVPLARKASLARFLQKRKQRVASAATPYSFGEKSPGKKDSFPMVSLRNKIPFGNVEESWVFGNPKNMNGSYDEETLNTELKI